MKGYSVGVIVGDFQTPDLSAEQIRYICNIKDKYTEVEIYLNVSVTKGMIETPLNFEIRESMIRSLFPSIRVRALYDCKSDEEWSKNLDNIIKPMLITSRTKVVIYTYHRFLARYKGKFKIKEFSDHEYYSSYFEDIYRTKCGQVAENNSSFRKGVVWSTQNTWPKVYPTVDIAVIRLGNKSIESINGKTDDKGNTFEVLLGKKKNSKQLRFPGGFVDPSDLSYEKAAQRELKEETNLDISGCFLEYISSRLIDDWRYKGRDKIITTFFSVMISKGESILAKAGDDLAEIGWYPLHEVIVPEDHGFLLNDLKIKRLGVE